MLAWHFFACGRLGLLELRVGLCLQFHGRQAGGLRRGRVHIALGRMYTSAAGLLRRGSDSLGAGDLFARHLQHGFCAIVLAVPFGLLCLLVGCCVMHVLVHVVQLMFFPSFLFFLRSHSCSSRLSAFTRISSPGFSCASAVTAPIACTTGFMSSGGAVTNCTACTPGTVSSMARDYCQACAAGYQCANPSLGAVSCTSGSYSLGGTVLTCTPCPAGALCASTSAAPVACAFGTYSLGNATACLQCPAGFVSIHRFNSS